jgi:type IV pilus assembly protein PilV
MQTQLNFKKPIKSAKHQAGALLIEALIAILIFSFGLLGLVGMQAISIQNSTNAEERIRASMLVNDMVSTMWINKSTNPSADIGTWQTSVTSALPNGVGTVTISGKEATVAVTWKSPSKKSTDNSSHYETTVAMP